MHTLLKELELRFDAKHIKELHNDYGDFILIDADQFTGSILLTNNLSDFKMRVHEKHVGEEFNELYCYLPSYWDSSALDNPAMNWVFIWLERIKKYVIEKETWLGNGHTLPCGKEMNSLSSSMLQNHFMISNPIALSKFLMPITIQDKTIRFLALIPIFSDEMDYKQGKGTLKLLDKLKHHGVTEKLDDFRSSVLKRHWKFFGK
jgi:hypothetical protein